MISQSAEYTLRAVACVAAAPGGRPMTARQIARAVRVPAGYLSKILQLLARAGVVTSQRGLNGGFVLARPPQELTLLELVRWIDGSRRITVCPLGLPEHTGQLFEQHRPPRRGLPLGDHAGQKARPGGGGLVHLPPACVAVEADGRA